MMSSSSALNGGDPGDRAATSTPATASDARSGSTRAGPVRAMSGRQFEAVEPARRPFQEHVPDHGACGGYRPKRTIRRIARGRGDNQLIDLTRRFVQIGGHRNKGQFRAAQVARLVGDQPEHGCGIRARQQFGADVTRGLNQGLPNLRVLV